MRAIAELRQVGLAHLVQLGETLASWRQQIAAMWRFTKNNGITEGFRTKMEALQRQAYGFAPIIGVEPTGDLSSAPRERHFHK